MSHLKERKEKNCLNCNALVYGKYCHVCGQENTEPAETVWHLISHFFNDITHFDGKFFSTLKLLITKPGFLSAEYKRGRRASYLNPVRMYIFTSFVFFVIFFSLFHVEDSIKLNVGNERYKLEDIYKMDSAQFAIITSKLSKDSTPMTPQEFKVYLDSINAGGDLNFFGEKYSSRKQYDSLIETGAIHPGWIKKKLVYRQFEIKDKYRNDKNKMMGSIVSTFLHMFPQILFVSLPLFAFILWLLYLRRKEFYFVSHGIYSIHLYIFYFIVLLCLMGLQKLEDAYNLDWLGIFTFLLFVALFVYEYKAMRCFYKQGRIKTMLKFFLAAIWRFIIFILLAFLFLIFSIYKL